MKIHSLNISGIKTVEWNGRTIQTGIFKEPVDRKLIVNMEGIEGDEQADKLHHGGELKAVYSYALEHYDYWKNIYPDVKMIPGLSGENLTTEGLDESAVCIGDRFRIGTSVLEAIQPREPCHKLEIVFDDKNFQPKYMESGRWGVYFRVIEEGFIQQGAKIELIEKQKQAVPINEMLRIKFFDKKNISGIEKILLVEALVPKWRERFEKLLSEAK